MYLVVCDGEEERYGMQHNVAVRPQGIHRRILPGLLPTPIDYVMKLHAHKTKIGRVISTLQKHTCILYKTVPKAGWREPVAVAILSGRNKRQTLASESMCTCNHAE